MRRTIFIALFLVSAFSSVAFAAYAEESALIKSFDSAELKGMWTRPAADPQAAVLILQGSGNVSMDGDVSSPFLGSGYKGLSANLSAQIAHTLAEKGIASLRYSKRGVDDAAQLPNQTIPYLLKDASAAFELLTQKFVGRKAGIVGLSEGALLATMYASNAKVDALFLLGTPTKSIDELIAYQFLEWPVSIARNLDRDLDGVLSASEISGVQFPMLGQGFGLADPKVLDSNKDGSISITDELIPSYQALHGAILQIARTQMTAWYKAMSEVPAFATMAAKITAPVYLYHAMNDAQVKWAWIASDYAAFAGQKTLKLYSGVGHCFSPMDGTYGEVKTSGPISQDVLSDLGNDVSATLK